MPGVRYKTLFQINTRVWLQHLSREAGRHVTLDDIDATILNGFVENGFDWIYLLSVWQTGAAGRAVSCSNPEWRREFATLLPDLTEEDICGSGFAITSYSVSETLGGEPVLARLRERLASRNIELMLDFVPNHTAPDHPWVRTRPDFYVQGNEETLSAAPHNYMRVQTDQGPRILAYGRDPNYPGWPDTLQLDYHNPELQRAQIDELIAIAGKCDGVRCDMAMLMLPEVCQRTWGNTPEPFWAKATAAVHAKYPDFTFMAEVYWDLEATLQQEGFAYCYDKLLYDRLKEGNASSVRDHLMADLDYQDRLARFLENHDEPRAASAFPWPRHQAAAVITFLSPGLRFFHQGQFDGARIRVPVHLHRGPDEPVDAEIQAFYARLLQVLKTRTSFREGNWSQIQPQAAWPGNWTSDDFVSCTWTGRDDSRYVVVVNYADNQGQCRLFLPFPELRGRQVRLTDLMADEVYDRDGTDILDNGLYIDHSPWHFNVFGLHIAGG
jgi:hypothetical protein